MHNNRYVVQQYCFCSVNSHKFFLEVKMGFAVGKVPRGEDFFPRDDIINKLWNIIEAEHHVLLLAPRRFWENRGFMLYARQSKTGLAR